MDHSTSQEQLRQKGYRLTPQRSLLLSILQESVEHLTIDEIVRRVQQVHPYVSISTIYRNLEVLQKEGLLQKHLFPEGNAQAFYEVPHEQPHAHLFCRCCHQVSHFSCRFSDQIRQDLEERYPIHCTLVNVQIDGYCERCWRQLMLSGETASARSIAGAEREVGR
jgi:Fur family ferric uptake transcriptional regulator